MAIDERYYTFSTIKENDRGYGSVVNSARQLVSTLTRGHAPLPNL
jgi:hypothetical protein